MARGDHHPRLLQRALTVLLFGLVAVGAGCTGMLQNLGARWATNKISAVFDLDDAQREATRAAVDRAIEAAPELIGPRLDLLVATVDRALAKGLNEQNMRIIERQIDILMDETVGWIIGEAAPILATLRDDQIDHAERELDERLDETREELNAEPTERLESRQEKFVDAIEKWTGRLSSSQTHAIRAQVAAMTDEAADRLRADEKRLGDIANALRAHPDAPAIREILWSAWKQREDWGPGTRSADARRADGRTTLFFVYGLLDDEQKDHMSERLHEMHASVQTLIGTGER
jgi:hypothetical protein